MKVRTIEMPLLERVYPVYIKISFCLVEIFLATHIRILEENGQLLSSFEDKKGLCVIDIFDCRS